MTSFSDETPLLGGSRSSSSLSPKSLESAASTGYTKADFFRNLRDFSIGLVNSILTIPCMVGYTAIVFSHEAFRPFTPMLAKLILFAAVIHQVVFCLMSTMPFAIGQVQDAGLIFLAAISTSVAQLVASTYQNLNISQLHDVNPSTDVSTIDPRLYEYASVVTTTSVVCMALCTAALGLTLVFIGKARLTKFVSYLPMPVISGYLAFIGLFCLQAGFSLSTGLSVASPSQWGQLWELEHIIHLIPGVLGGVVIVLVSRFIKHPLAIPLAMIGMLTLFFSVLYLTGTSLVGARQMGWVNEAAPSVGVADIFTIFDLSKIQWWTMPYQIPQWMAMTFVVAFSSCLDVAAIEIDLGRSLDVNKELSMIGWSNFLVGLSGNFGVGSYIFSQTLFTYRTGSLSRLVGWVVAIAELLVFILPTDVLAFVPRFFFAATLIFIGIDLCYEWLIEVVLKKKVSLHEHTVSITTFVAMIVTNIEMGLVIGILAAIIHFIIRYVKFSRMSITYHRSTQALPLPVHQKLTDIFELERDIKVLELSGYVFFGSSLSLLDEVKKAILVAVSSHNDEDGTVTPTTELGVVGMLKTRKPASTYVMSVYELEELTRLHGERPVPPVTSIPVTEEATMKTSHVSNPEKSAQENLSSGKIRTVSYGATDAVPLVAGMGSSLASDEATIPTNLKLSSLSYHEDVGGPLHTVSHPIPVDMTAKERTKLKLKKQRVDETDSLLSTSSEETGLENTLSIASSDTAPSLAQLEPVTVDAATQSGLLQILPTGSPSSRSRVPTQAVIVDCSRVIGVDSTALRSCFLIVSHLARSHHCDLIYAGLSADVIDLMISNNVIVPPHVTVQHDIEALEAATIDMPVATAAATVEDAENGYELVPVSSLSSSGSSFTEVPTVNGKSIYSLFELERSLPSVSVAWGCVCTASTVEAALRWSEARLLAKKDCE